MDNNNNNVVVTEKKGNGVAIAGFVLSFFIPLVGLILSIVGAKKSKETNSGKGLSIAGIILSSIGLILSLIFTIAIILGFNSVNNIINESSDIVSDARCATVDTDNCYESYDGSYSCSYFDDDYNYISFSCNASDLDI